MQPAYGLSNIAGHMSSTWTAIGLVIAAVGPIFAQGAPTNTAGWITTGGILLAAVVKALGR